MPPSPRPPSQEPEFSAQRQALEFLARGASLADFLEQMCLLLESGLAEGRSSILLLDEDQVHLRQGAAPSLPKAYVDRLEGLAIGPVAGSCGTAMYRGASVVVEDIERDPLWAPYRAAALPFGLKACASLPILTADRQVLGAFALYLDHPGPFPQADLDLLGTFTGVVALALESHRRANRLRDEEARHRALVTQSQEGIFYFNLEDFRVLESNPAFQELVGYSAEQLLRLRLNDLVANAQGPSWENPHPNLDPGARLGGERLYRHRAGELIPVEVTATALNIGGHWVCSVVVRDIRARRAAERDLALREAQLQAIMDQAGDAILVADAQGRYLDANPKALEVTGYTLEEFRKLTFFQLLDPEELASQPLRLSELRAGKSLLVERKIVRKDGSLLQAELSAQFLSDGRFLFVGRDITARKQLEEEATVAEAALAESERTFRSLFDLSPGALVLSEPADGSILIANPAAFSMLQLEPEEIQGKRTTDFFVHVEDRQRLLKAMKPTGSTRDFELEMLVHGHPRVVLLAGAILTYLGKPAILVALTDITKRQREEESLRQRQKLESLGVLAGGIAHDFNNLLTAILGNLNLAQLHLPENAPAAPYLTDMEAVVQRAADLSRQMLAYSGKGRFRQEFVSLNTLVEEMTHLLSVSISKRVQLHLELGANLPVLEGDPVQLQQVVMNLVTNASEAIGDHNGVIRIRTALEFLDPSRCAGLRLGEELACGDYLLLEVQDSGSGIPAETLERIFDPFFTTKSTGRGLGLSALLGILRGHKAALAIESIPDKGTRFSLFFTPSAHLGELSQAAPAARSELLQGWVLVVDDEAPVRASLSQLLRHLGLQVSQASDGVEALERLAEVGDQVDCVILDLTMPRMDGRETLRHIRQKWPNLPVILSSGFSTQEGDLELAGPGAFLGKPYRLAELKEILLKLLPCDPKGTA